MAFGDNGLIGKAEYARDLTANSTYTEQKQINDLLVEYANIIGEDYVTPPEDWDLTKVTPVLSKDNKYVPVPNGFTASTIEEEKNVNDGFVIKQGNDGSAITGVNEFVWIPVDSTSLNEMYQEAVGTPLSTYTGVDTITDVYSKLRDESGTIGGIPGSTIYREPDILLDTTYGDAVSGNSLIGIEQIKIVFGFSGTDSQVLDSFADMLVADYEANYASIKKYGGFYIGRYELTGNLDTPTVQKGQDVLTNQNWYNLYKACNNLVQSDYVQSTMIYGSQWDETLNWVLDTEAKTSSDIYTDSRSWGNYGTNAKRPAGYSETWKVNNIYDIAGNCYEWTQEANGTDGRVLRGGYCGASGSDRPASYRGNYGPYDSLNGYGSRPILYIK